MPDAGADPVILRITPSRATSDSEGHAVLHGSGFEANARVALRPGGPFVAGRVRTAGQISGVAIRDDLVFLAAGEAGLVVVDVSDRNHPRIVGDVRLPAVAVDVAVEGSIAYVATSAGLAVVDAADPAAPVLLGTLPLTGRILRIDVDGSFAYLACGRPGLRIIDIRDPARPTLAGSFITTDDVLDVTVQAELAFIAAGRVGLVTLDVGGMGRPGFPRRLSTLRMPNRFAEAEALAVAGDHAFVMTDATDGLVTIDVRVPERPVFVGTTMETAIGSVLAWSENTLFVGSLGGLALLDVNVPQAPRFLTRVTAFWARGLAVSDGYAYWGDGTDLAVVDARYPAPRLERSRLLIPGGDLGFGAISAIAVRDSLAALGMNRGGIVLVDISNPYQPLFLSRFHTTFKISDVLLIGEHAFLTDTELGLYILDISDPVNPIPIGRFPDRNTAMVVASRFAYVGSGGSTENASTNIGLRVLEISDLGSVRGVRFTRTPGVVRNLSQSGSRVAAAAGPAGLLVFSVDNPSAPRLVGRWSPPVGHVIGVQMADNLAFVAITNYQFQPQVARLAILDIGAATSPQLLASMETYAPWRVTVSDGLAYIADLMGGVKAIDARVPERPLLLASYPMFFSAQDVEVNAEHAFVAGSGGLQVLRLIPSVEDVSVLNQSTILTSIPGGLPDGFYDVVVANASGTTTLLRNGFEIEAPREQRQPRNLPKPGTGSRVIP